MRYLQDWARERNALPKTHDRYRSITHSMVRFHRSVVEDFAKIVAAAPADSITAEVFGMGCRYHRAMVHLYSGEIAESTVLNNPEYGR
jgi:hypothetical protein